MGNKPLVSICCATYNHEKYIEDTLKSFLMQEDIDYEILIHDDASTDKTAEIIRVYERKYPDKIFPIYQTENQYSQGKKYSDLNYERVKGKYVAICEGDDYWIDSKKLKKQVEAMGNNPSCEICFHPAICKNFLSNQESIIGEYAKEIKIIDIKSVIEKKFGMIPTASLLMRKEVLERVLEYKGTRPYLTVGDLYFQIFGSMKGGALFINKAMSVYRYFTEESWSLQQLKSNKRQVEHLISMTKSYQELNRLTKYLYWDAFELSTIKRIFSVTDFNSLENLPTEFSLYKNLMYKYLGVLKNKDETYVLYAFGVGAKMIIEVLGEKIDYIIDKDENKKNIIYMGKKVYSLEKLKDIKNRKIIISIIGRSFEVMNELDNKYDIKKNQLISFDKELVEVKLLDKLEI